MPNGTYERIKKISDTLPLSLKLRERDPKTEKGPHGDPGPQMGTHVASAMGTSFGNNLRKHSQWFVIIYLA